MLQERQRPLVAGPDATPAPARASRRRPDLGHLAILALVVAYAVLVQGPGWNQNAHYSLVRALADGTPAIDETRFETGPWYVTGDITAFRGHVYAAKAPGLAFESLPAYLAFRALGVWSSGDSTPMLWLLTLVGAVLPAGVLLLLVRAAADRLAPGSGTPVAVTLGAGTLIMPFATLFFAHALSATLGFAAFAVVRRGEPRRAALAGLLGGLATTVEYPLAIVAAVVGLYALAQGPRLGRALAYAGGAAAGLAPLFLYQWWAFGSATHFAYADAVGGLNRRGFLGVGVPSFRVAMELLFSTVGLLRLSPVLALAIAGCVLLYRRGFRAEALSVCALAVAYVVYDSGYETPFGGSSPGPRFLVPVLPFLALALAPLVRERPLTLAALAVPSVVLLAAVTATHPMVGIDGRFVHRLVDGQLSATVVALATRLRLDPALALAGSAHWYPLLLFFFPVAAAVCLGAPRGQLRWRDAATGAACLGGWLVADREGPRLVSASPGEALALAAAVAVLALALPHVVRAER